MGLKCRMKQNSFEERKKVPDNKIENFLDNETTHYFFHCLHNDVNIYLQSLDSDFLF